MYLLMAPEHPQTSNLHHDVNFATREQQRQQSFSPSHHTTQCAAVCLLCGLQCAVGCVGCVTGDELQEETTVAMCNAEAMFERGDD